MLNILVARLICLKLPHDAYVCSRAKRAAANGRSDHGLNLDSLQRSSVADAANNYTIYMIVS